MKIEFQKSLKLFLSLILTSTVCLSTTFSAANSQPINGKTTINRLNKKIAILRQKRWNLKGMRNHCLRYPDLYLGEEILSQKEPSWIKFNLIKSLCDRMLDFDCKSQKISFDINNLNSFRKILETNLAAANSSPSFSAFKCKSTNSKKTATHPNLFKKPLERILRELSESNKYSSKYLNLNLPPEVFKNSEFNLAQ